MPRALFLLIFSALAFCVTAAADDHSLADKIASAANSDARPEADRARDSNRMPMETLSFFRLEDDMRVLELIPGGGWYTRLLAPTLRDNGQLYVAIGTRRVAEAMTDDATFAGIEVLETEENLRRPEGSMFYAVDAFDLGVTDLDMVLTFRNMHNFDADSREIINKEVFKSLKSGGLYGVVDHTRRHMEATTAENRRRIDPVIVILEMTRLGFEFVDFSDLHYRADDELEYEVGRRSVSGNTDRFTLLFRKP